MLSMLSVPTFATEGVCLRRQWNDSDSDNDGSSNSNNNNKN